MMPVLTPTQNTESPVEERSIIAEDLDDRRIP